MQRLSLKSEFGWLVFDFAESEFGFTANGKKSLGAVMRFSIETKSVQSQRPTAGGRVVMDLLSDYLAGELATLDRIAVGSFGSDFSQRVKSAMRLTAAGDWTTYKSLAVAAGSPNATRAAGSVCATNEIPLIVPCHRVLRSDGSVGNYYYGSELKVALLEHEGINF